MEIIDSVYSINTIQVNFRMPTPLSGSLRQPGELNSLLQQIYDPLDNDQEHFSVIALDTNIIPIGFKVISTGTQDSATIDLPVLFRKSLLLGATSIVIVHNHPSGNPEPSINDVATTLRIRDGAALIGLNLFDHVILGASKFFSFKKDGAILR